MILTIQNARAFLHNSQVLSDPLPHVCPRHNSPVFRHTFHEHSGQQVTVEGHVPHIEVVHGARESRIFLETPAQCFLLLPNDEHSAPLYALTNREATFVSLENSVQVYAVSSVGCLPRLAGVVPLIVQ